MPSESPPSSEDAVSRNPMPTQLGRYEVRAKLADGGMATIYLGRLRGAEGFERPVALKVIKDQFIQNREFVTMFMDEAKIVSRVSHPNVVQLYELGTEKDRLFIAMELLVGQSLWNVWQACRERQACLRQDLIAWIGARVGEGLHHAHELKGPDGKSIELVHRDVNASNIFITYDGHVKLIDFGLVKATNRVSRTAEGIVKGKLAYMSPEQALGKPIDRRTDIFALGTTLWELTTDRRLFKREKDLDTLRSIKDAVVPDPTLLVKGYPPKLWETLKRSLQRDPNERYATVKEMVKDLDECAGLEGRTVSAGTLSEVMHALFGQERERQLAWVNEVSEKPAEQPTSVPNPYESPLKFAEMGSKVEPIAGTLVASSSRELPRPPDTDVVATGVEPTPIPTKKAESVRPASAPPRISENLVATAPSIEKSRKGLIVVVAVGSAAVVVVLAVLVATFVK